MAAQGPEKWGIGVVCPPTQAMVKVTHRKGGHWRKSGHCRAARKEKTEQSYMSDHSRFRSSTNSRATRKAFIFIITGNN